MDQELKAIEFVFGVVDRLPPWIQSVVLSLVAVALVLYLIKHIFKTLTDPEFINAARTLGGAVRRAMFALLRGIFAPLESPIQRPRTKLAFAWLSVVHSYLSAVIFFIFILIFSFFYVVAKHDMSFLQDMVALGVFLVLFYFMVFFRVEADRDYLKAKELWSQRGAGK